MPVTAQTHPEAPVRPGLHTGDRPSAAGRAAGLLRGRADTSLLVLVALTGVFAYLAAQESYYLPLLCQAAAFAVVVVGLDLLMGIGGQLALGQAALMGVSAYTTVVLSDRLGWPLGLSIVCGLGACVLIAVLLSPMLRLKGIYFGVASLVLALIFESLVNATPDLTGGPSGLAVVDSMLFSLDLSRPEVLFPIAWICLLVAIRVVLRLRGSRFGVALDAVREDPDVAAASGISVRGVKARAWLLAALLAGVGGLIFSFSTLYLTPHQFGLQPSILVIMMLVLGGERTVFGPAAAAVAVTLLPTWLAGWEDQANLVYALVVVAVVVLAPGGIGGLVRDVAGRLLARGDTNAPQWAAVRRTWRVDEVRRDEGRGRDTGRDDYGRSGGQAPTGARVLRLAHVSRTFGGLRALCDVTFDVSPGETVGLIGPNGAGKSTLVNIVSGLDRGGVGEIEVRQTPASRLAPHEIARLGLRRTFQRARPFAGLTVFENVLGGAYTVGRSSFLASVLDAPRERRSRREMTAAALGALHVVGLADRAGALAGGLATGEQRLLEVARAIAGAPPIVLLDEPAAGLNDVETARLADVLRSLNRAGVGIVLIEHHMELVSSVCSRLTVLDLGRQIAIGTVAEVQRSPQVIKAYLGG